MTLVKFVAKISSKGPEWLIINIPKDLHTDIKKIKARQVRVMIDEAF